jgi:hypothetical protein
VKRIGDIGSGTLRNLRVQENNFDEITLIETAIRCVALQSRVAGKNHIRLQTTKAFEEDQTIYDAIFFISVLHTIPERSYRQHLVNIAVTKIRPGGFIVVDVPQSETYYNRRRQKLLRYRDGYLLRWGGHYSFYKSFYKKGLDSMFAQIPGVQLFQKIGYCKHLIRIWKVPS